jgi:hypothetical protein
MNDKTWNRERLIFESGILQNIRRGIANARIRENMFEGVRRVDRGHSDVGGNSDFTPNLAPQFFDQT